MKKIIQIVILTIFSLPILHAQNVGINSTGATPDSSAMLDIVNSSKGLLIPRVALQSTTDAVTIPTPANSLLVFNNNAAMTGGQGTGYYYNSGSTGSPLWIKLAAANDAWLLKGNAAITTPAVPATYGTTNIAASENFLGTTNGNDVVIGTNNIERFRVKQTTGNIGIGTASPAYKLDILAPGNTIGVRILSGNTAQVSYLSLGRTTEYAQIGACTAGTFFLDAAAGDMAVKNYNSGKILLGASFSANADMSLLPNGNVGIHTVTPGTIFDVKGNNNWNTGTGEGDVRIGDPTYRLKIGVANGGAGAGDIRITAGGGTNRIFLGGSTNTTALTVDGTNNRIGIRNNAILPLSALDIDGDLALREGPAISLPAATTYPVITLSGNEFSHYRFTGATVPFIPYTISGGNDGQVVTFINNTGQPMGVYNWDVANGIMTGTGNNLTANLTATSNNYQSFTVIYNATLQRWILTSFTGMSNDIDWHTTGNTATNDPVAPATYGTSTISSNENWAGTKDANDYVIGTNTIERVRVKQTTGNVGIGISAPSYKLHVVDPAAYATATYSENTYVGNADGTGIYGRSVNNPYYGTGGQFYGGYTGVYAGATTSGTGYRYGGQFNGWYGASSNYGIYGYGYGGGSSYGAYGYAAGATTNYGGYFSSGGSGYGVYSTIGSASSNGVYAGASGSASNGLYANASSTNSNGIIGYSGGNFFDLGFASCTNCGSPTTSTWVINPNNVGVGGAGEYTGVQGKAYYANTATYDKMGGLFYVAGYNGTGTWSVPAIATVGSIVDGTVYKIVGYGIVSTLVKDKEDKERIMVAPEAPEALFQDFGVGKLENGKAIINLDPTLSKNILVDEKHPMKVFIQLEGDCKGVFVTNKSATGFEVVELNQGTSTINFSYQIVANRADEDRGGQISHYADMRFKPLNRQFILDESKVKLYKESEKARIESEEKAMEEQKKSQEKNKLVNSPSKTNTN